MATAQQNEAPYASEFRLLDQAAETRDEGQQRIGPRLRRAEVRRRVRRFLEGVLAPVARQHGGPLAEALGERSPPGVQRLLAEADWDQEAGREQLPASVLDHLGDAARIRVVAETGFVTKGKQSAGVAPQSSGTAGGRATCPIGVFRLYASPHGAAFSDRERELPEEGTLDRVRCREAGLPACVRFSPTGELAQRLLARACAAGGRAAWGRAAWVVGETMDSADEVRPWLQGPPPPPYVLAVAETHPVGMAGRAPPVGVVAALLPEAAWPPLSAGEGTQGPRLDTWAGREVDAAPAVRGQRCGASGAGPAVRGRWRSGILIRRSWSAPSKRA